MLRLAISTTWTILMFYWVTLSSTMYSPFGFSKLSRSMYFLASPIGTFIGSMILSGKRCLHNSHSIAFQQYVLTDSFDFMVHLELSHSRRQSMWISFIVPAHLQGDMSGFFSSSLSSLRHILQTCPPLSDRGESFYLLSTPFLKLSF